MLAIRDCALDIGTMKCHVLLAAACLALSVPAAASAQPILGAEAEYARVAAQARAYFTTGRYQDALILTRDAHAFIAGELGPRHLLALKSLNDIAVIHLLQGQFDIALPIALAAVSGLEREAGPDHAETLNALANLAQLHIGRSDLASAEPLLRRVLDGRSRTLGAAAEATLNSLLELAVFMKRAGRLRELAGPLDRGAATAWASFGADSAITLDLTAAAGEANGRVPASGGD